MVDPVKTNLFQSREHNVIVRVNKVDDTFAYITVVRALPSHYAMPVAEYDTRFASRYMPVDAGATELPEDYRPPLDQSAWQVPEEPEFDPSRGETEEGVRFEAFGTPR